MRKSFMAAALLLAAGVQTAQAQKVVINKTDGSYISYDVSTVGSIDFIEAGGWLVRKIELNETSVTMKPDEMKTLTATVLPSDADNKAVTWESSNEDVAEVTKNGKVIANANGTCVITCTAADGSGVKADCKVTVSDVLLVTDIKLNYASLTFTLPDKTSQTIEVTVLPADAANKSITWASSSSSVATVDQTGKVTAVGEGSCTITCSATDGSNVKGECQVIVNKTTQGTTDGHDWVDLGLPSGTLWATCNIGANKSEEYGDYFCWGETKGYLSGKTDFGWRTYKYCNHDEYNKLTKYCIDSKYGYNGFADGKTELDADDDAATVNWSTDWQMPCKEQWIEVFDESNTTIEWTRQNGVMGCKIISKRNSNYIFMPAAGSRSDTILDQAGTHGYYWSRSLLENNSCHAYRICLNTVFVEYSIDSMTRWSGYSVRPVRKQ